MTDLLGRFLLVALLLIGAITLATAIAGAVEIWWLRRRDRRAAPK